MLGFCPLVVGVGCPESGKTKAGNVALATVGGFPHLFFELFTDSHNGIVASKTTLGFHADDPSEPGEIGMCNQYTYCTGTSKFPNSHCYYLSVGGGGGRRWGGRLLPNASQTIKIRSYFCYQYQKVYKCLCL